MIPSEVLELLDKLNITVNLGVVQGAGLALSVFIMSKVKAFLKSRRIAFDPKVKPWAFLGISAAVSVGALVAQTALTVPDAVALTALTWMTGMGYHQTQKVIRKGGDDPRRH